MLVIGNIPIYIPCFLVLCTLAMGDVGPHYLFPGCEVNFLVKSINLLNIMTLDKIFCKSRDDSFATYISAENLNSKVE